MGPREAASGHREGNAFGWETLPPLISSASSGIVGLGWAGLGQVKWGLLSHPEHKIWYGTRLGLGVWTLLLGGGRKLGSLILMVLRLKLNSSSVHPVEDT